VHDVERGHGGGAAFGGDAAGVARAVGAGGAGQGRQQQGERQ